jgi:hypothetical protein
VANGVSLGALEGDLAEEFAHYHWRAHLLQFAGLFAASFATAVAAAGWHVAGWAALGSMLLGCVGAVLRQMFPQVPWPAVLGALERAKSAPSGPQVPGGIVTPTITAPKT